MECGCRTWGRRLLSWSGTPRAGFRRPSRCGASEAAKIASLTLTGKAGFVHQSESEKPKNRDLFMHAKIRSSGQGTKTWQNSLGIALFSRNPGHISEILCCTVWNGNCVPTVLEFKREVDVRVSVQHRRKPRPGRSRCDAKPDASRQPRIDAEAGNRKPSGST